MKTRPCTRWTAASSASAAQPGSASVLRLCRLRTVISARLSWSRRPPSDRLRELGDAPRLVDFGAACIAHIEAIREHAFSVADNVRGAVQLQKRGEILVLKIRIMWEHGETFFERGKDACEVAQFTLDPADRIGDRAMIELSLIDDRKVGGETDIDAARAQKVQLRRLVGRAGVDVRAIADLEVSSRLQEARSAWSRERAGPSFSSPSSIAA